MEKERENSENMGNYDDLENGSGLFPGEKMTSALSDSPDEVYPAAKVNIEKNQWAVDYIKSLVKEGNMLIINPDFQRNDVWNLKRKCELIESILMGIPLPVIYLFETVEGKYQVVDGKQRLSTILEFINDGFKLTGLSILTDKQYKNVQFSKLSPKMQMQIRGYQLYFYIIKPPTSERVKYDIFDRVNRGGVRLNNQEMRDALYHGRATDVIKELAKSEEFQNATGKGVSSNRKKDEYIVLRLVSFYMLFTHQFDKSIKPIVYKGDIEDFLAKSMEYINVDSTDEEMAQIKATFLRAMKKIYTHIGNDAFRFAQRSSDKQRRPVNMLLFDALGYLFMNAEDLNMDLSNVDYARLKRSLDESELFDGKNESEVKLLKRFQFIISKAQEYDRKSENKKL